MKREVIRKLEAWKENEGRRPLLLMGARQVGKTWLMQEFGRQNYREVAYVSFDSSELMRRAFEQDFNVERLLAAIRLHTGCRVEPRKTLIILDEIQEFLDALEMEQVAEAIRQHAWEQMNKFSVKLEELLCYYYYIGGMPGVVAEFVKTRDFASVRSMQDAVLRGCSEDIGKHATA